MKGDGIVGPEALSPQKGVLKNGLCFGGGVMWLR